MRQRDALTAAASRLAGVSETPRLDAELLMAHALGVSREAMLLGDGEEPEGFEALIERRAAHEPVAYITGRKAFWTIELEVGPVVLIPRPDSETLIEAVVEYFNPPHRLAMGRWQSEGLTEGNGAKPLHHSLRERSPSPSQVDGEDSQPGCILDLGTGSGALLLAALAQWPFASGLGIDASDAALAVAQCNGDRIAPGRAAFQLGDWGAGVEERFDLILCNPPYVGRTAALPRDVADYEPAAALYAGPDGLDCYRRIIPDLPRLLAPGGMVAVEIGSTQAEPVCALFRQAGLSPQIRHDLAGLPRAVVHFALGSDRAAR